MYLLVKFVYSEKASKFCEISTLLLSTVHTDKKKVDISQNFVAFSEYMNFIRYYFFYIPIWNEIKVQIFWGGRNNLKISPTLFTKKFPNKVRNYYKFCGLLTIYDFFARLENDNLFSVVRSAFGARFGLAMQRNCLLCEFQSLIEDWQNDKQEEEFYYVDK